MALAALAGKSISALMGTDLPQDILDLLGFDMPGIPGVAAPTAPRARKTYSVQIHKGRIVDQGSGRTIGYTPQQAKKKYKTRRRRKRWTQRDEKEWNYRLAIAQVQAGKPAIVP